MGGKTIAALAAGALALGGVGAAAVATEDTATSPNPSPTIQAQTAPPHAELASTGSYTATVHWAGVTEPGQTGYYVYQDGTQVADVPTPSYTFTGLNCGTTFTLGVAAHDSSGGTSPTSTTSYSTPACPSGGGGGGGGVLSFCTITAAYTNLTTGPHLCGWPDSTNTGYTNAPSYPGSLTIASSGSSTCPTTPVSGHTYSFCEYNGGTGHSLDLPANLTNTTFYGDSFESNNEQIENVGAGANDNNITFNYDTFSPLPGVTPAQAAADCTKDYEYGIYNENSGGRLMGFTVEHSDFYGFGVAIDSGGSTQTNPQVFNDNWLHDAAPGSPYGTNNSCGYHNDGIGLLSTNTTSYVTLDHNTMEFLGNTNIIAWQNGTYDHMTTTNNLLSGNNVAYAGGRCTSACTPPTNITTQGNTLSTYVQLSPPGTGGAPIDNATNFWSGTGDVWNHNYWAVPPGAAWGTSANNGLFWVPTTDTNTPQDCGFVSTTDWPTVHHPSPC